MMDAAGRPAGDITIAILKGMPEEVFRVVLVHEFAHAYLRCGTWHVELPDVLEEGFAEALAYWYLERHRNSPAAARQRQLMWANPDPTYGGGLRLVLPVLGRRGPTEVARALRTGQPSSVGLVAPAVSPGRQWRPVSPPGGPKR